MKLKGAMLKGARERMGLTQTRAAELADVKQATLCNAEHGRSVLPTTAKKLCDFLGIEIEAAMRYRTGGTDAA